MKRKSTLLTTLFGGGRREALDHVSDVIGAVAAGERLSEIASRVETDKELEEMLGAAIENTDEDEYGRIVATVLAAPLVHKRQQLASLLVQEDDLAYVAKLLFAAFRSGWRSSDEHRLRAAVDAGDREVSAILESSIAERRADAALRLDDYFKNAVRVFAEIGHLPARTAAVASSAAVEPSLRQLQIGYLKLFTMSLTDPLKVRALADLADEIAAREWTIDDVTQKTLELRAADTELADCLDDSDPTAFPRRWPDLFVDG